MLVDKPLELSHEAWDDYNKKRFLELQSIIEGLYEKNQTGAITVSINGAWGTGKSSYLNGLKQYYQKEHPVVFFEAWRYADEPDIFLALLEELYASSDKIDFKNKLRPVIKGLGVAFLVGTDALIKNQLGISIKKDAEHYLKLLDKHIRDYTTNTTKQRQKLANAIKLISSEEKPLVILIDDLDRLIPEKAFKLLERLRFFFEGDHTIIVMAINDQVINRYAHEKHGLGSMVDSENFIDKIFHYTFELHYNAYNELHLTDFNISQQQAITEILDAISNQCGALRLAHRKWINIINRIEVGYTDDMENEALQELIITSILLELYPDFNYMYREQEEILLDTAQLLEDIIKDISYHYPQELFECLLKILRGERSLKEEGV